MARFSFSIYDQTSDTLLAGMIVNIKNATGTLLASTTPPGAEKQIVDNGDGTYYTDDMAANLLTVYVGASLTAQPELTSIPWDNGAGATHSALTTAHGSTGDVIGEGDVDDSSIEFSGGLRVKALGIVTAMLAALSVTEGKIGALAVTESKIGALAVTLGKIAANAVDENKIVSTTFGNGIAGGGGTKPAVNISTVSGEVDMMFNGSGQLTLKKTLSSTSFLTAGMDFGQMMSVIDNRLRQLSELSSPEGGSYYQILYTLMIEDLTPSASLTSPQWVTTSAAYVDGLVMPVMKIPEMRQLVMYFRASVSDATADAYVKLFAGSLSSESAVIESLTPGNYALYLDITSLPSWATFELQASVKVSGGFTFTLDLVSVIVRSEITALSGATTYENPNPVE